MQAEANQPVDSEVPLQLFLFIDDRPKSRQEVQQVKSYLDKLQTEYRFELQVVDVGQKPYLAEHYKLIATPALVKVYPEPSQTIAGSNIINELKTWWPRWRESADAHSCLDGLEPQQQVENGNSTSSKSSIRSLALSTELIQLSDEIFRLKQEKEKLTEQLMFKDRVIGMLAHDLRNPLTAASIAIETLQSNYNVDKGAFERLKPSLTANLFRQARTQVKTIDRMITDLLQVGRGKDSDFRIQPEKMELAKLFQEVYDEFRDRITSKSLVVQKDIPKDLPAVYADPDRIRQVLVNLLDNAIKYTPFGGSLIISGLHRTTQKVQFSIADSGPGIPEENREHIFENRFRLERDEDIDGYGIGLCLCQRIIRAHYGQIWVDDSPIGGAWFHLILPVYPK